jgi:hypothetical protein
MKIANNTKGKITINREGIAFSLFPGESTNLNRIQLSKIRNLVDYFNLTIEEGKDVAPQFRRPAPKRTIQQIETVVGDKKKEEKPIIKRRKVAEPEVEEIELEEPKIEEPKVIELTPEMEAMKEEYEDKTAAELRALCKEAGLGVSGNRGVLINKLVEHFMG